MLSENKNIRDRDRDNGLCGNASTSFYVSNQTQNNLRFRLEKPEFHGSTYHLAQGGGLISDHYFYPGDVDELAMWNRALSGAEMQGLVPAPGAVVLGIIGVGMVGAYTRKRRAAHVTE